MITVAVLIKSLPGTVSIKTSQPTQVTKNAKKQVTHHVLDELIEMTGNKVYIVTGTSHIYSYRTFVICESRIISASSVVGVA